MGDGGGRGGGVWKENFDSFFHTMKWSFQFLLESRRLKGYILITDFADGVAYIPEKYGLPGFFENYVGVTEIYSNHWREYAIVFRICHLLEYLRMELFFNSPWKNVAFAS